jgi:hypothetical protein
MFILIGCIGFGCYSVIFRRPFLYVSQIQLTSLGGGRSPPQNTSLGIQVSLGCDNANYLPIYITKTNFILTIVSSTDGISFELVRDPITNLTGVQTTMFANNYTSFMIGKSFNLGDNYARLRQLFIRMSFEFKLNGKIGYEILKVPMEEEIHFHQKLYTKV